ncbi:AAA family ATPase, partial [Candidatus Micrarchaeota archaeon]|nr:AAA family ATPase [Candidatus Micrarchaeota archaeon]
LVFLGALFIIGSFPFYPVYVVPILALICAAVAYKVPYMGTLLSVIFTIPAVAYQSGIFGWIFFLVLAIVLFEMFENWAVVSSLEVLIFAPFAFNQFPLFGWVSIFGMAIASLHFGSRKSIAVAIPSVLAILFISSIWLVPNSAYMPVNLNLYTPGMEELRITKTPLEINKIAGGFGTAMATLTNPDVLFKVGDAIGIVINNLLKILFADTGILQIIIWGITLFAISFISGRIRGRRSQVISSLFIFFVPFSYYLISTAFEYPFKFELVFAAFSTVAAIGVLEQFNVNLSREVEIGRQEKMKSFGKFGVQDMALGAGEKSLDDIGNYEDVKQELKDSIVMPLEKKELAFAYGIKPPSGVLLFGPPGTGKTMLMRALAKELRYGFYYIKSSDILSQWFGESLPSNEKILIEKDGKVSLKEIGKVVEEKINGKVACFDQHGKVLFADIKDHIKHKCTSPILEVRTKTGRKIRVTDYHSLFTLNGFKVESVRTSQLIAGSSYIAIPKKIPFADKTVEEIDLIEALKENDYGLRIKNADELIKKAIKQLGEDRVCNLMKKDRVELRRKLRKKTFYITEFVKLMEASGIKYQKGELEVYCRKEGLPAVIKVTKELATFLGLWVAEGSYNRNYVVRVSTSLAESEDIVKLCRGLFQKVITYRKKRNNVEGFDVDIYIIGKPAFVLLHHILGLEHGAGNKNVPSIAFNFNKENLAGFLSGYFSGDGNIHQDVKKVMLVEASTVSKELANSLVYLLLRFGIVASLADKKEWNGSISKHIYFSGFSNVKKFTEIGFMQADKQERIKVYLSEVNWWRHEQIPINGELRERVVRDFPKYSNSASISKDMLNNVEEIEEVIESDIYFDRVEEIRQVEGEEFVYDISVDPTQNFIGGIGGIFAHNSEKNITELFAIARKNAPAILFFDEIDSIGKKRGAYSSDDVSPRVLSVMLQEIDGFKSSKKPLIVIGATNIPNQLDPALLRPGRCDKIIYMHLPDKEGRKFIFKVHMRKVPIADDIDFDKLAAKTERFSGADIKNVIDEAIKAAAKEASKAGVILPVTTEHLLQVLKSIKPSTGIAQLDEYEKFRLDFERRVGAKEELKEREEIVKWEDVVGLDKVKQTLLETIELPLLREDLMKEYKVKPSKGILLFGPPGTGKTLIVKAATSELKASFQSLSGAELMKSGYTQAVTVIKETFNRARENAPSIIFVDEIETIAGTRGTGSNEIIGQFLTEMDGLRELKGVVVLAATNKPSILDAAILRPGRFDKIFYIPPPTEIGRGDIFKIHLGKLAEKVDSNVLASVTDGFSGADIASIAQEVKMLAVRARLAGTDASVSTNTVLEIAKKRRPSITKNMLIEYKEFLEEYGERS